MDQDTIQYCKKTFDEIEEAVKPLGMILKRLELDDTEEVPTGILTLPDSERSGWMVYCNVGLSRIDMLSTGLVHIFKQLAAVEPEKLPELEAFVKGGNERFILGGLSLVEDGLVLRYLMALEPYMALPKEHFQATVYTFIQQSDNLIRRIQGIYDGTMTVEQALDFSVTE